MVSTILANANRGKDQEPFGVADFLPNWTGTPTPRKTQSPEEIMAIAGAIVRAKRRRG